MPESRSGRAEARLIERFSRLAVSSAAGGGKHRAGFGVVVDAVPPVLRRDLRQHAHGLASILDSATGSCRVPRFRVGHFDAIGTSVLTLECRCHPDDVATLRRDLRSSVERRQPRSGAAPLDTTGPRTRRDELHGHVEP